MISLNKNFNFILCYQCALVIATVFAFFTNLDIYLPGTGGPPSSPLIMVYILVGAAAPLLLSIFEKIKYLPLPIILWCAVYLLISLLSILILPGDEIQYRELRIRFLSVTFILTTIVIFSSKSPLIHLVARWSIFLALIMAIFNTIYNVFDPTAFRLDSITTSLRPAGFYVDANKTSCALDIGMIFSVGLVKPKQRIYLVSLIGLLNLLTFSRAGILCWIILVIIMLNKRVIPRRQVIKSTIGLGIIVLVISVLGSGLIEQINQLQASDKKYRDMFERMSWLQDPSSLSDDSSDARFEVAMIALQMFMQSPLLGNGIGSTLDLSIGISTHNMYVYFMADHGILGAFIMPLLAYAMIRNIRGETKYIGLCCAAMILLWSLFSHTVLEDRFILLMVSLMASMTAKSQLEQKSQLGRAS